MTKTSRHRGMPIACMFAVFQLTMIGCSETTNQPNAAAPNERHTARGFYEHQDFDRAENAIRDELIGMPGDNDLTLLAAKIAAANEKPHEALDFLSDVRVDDSNALEVARLNYDQNARLDDLQRSLLALDVLQKLQPDEARWQTQRWMILNRHGMRQEASRVADQLCRSGLATEQQMLSLASRGDSFPRQLAADESPQQWFSPGLGLARWHFTQNDLESAIKVLAAITPLDPPRPANPGPANAGPANAGPANAGPANAGPANPDSASQIASQIALYGRLLAETQADEMMPKWFLACDSTVEQQTDYWAAIGLIMNEHGRFEAATAALLQAVYRDPTDRVCFQRLGQSLAALGRREVAEQFRHTGISIFESQKLAESIHIHPNDATRQRMISQKLLTLYRPFETLQWAQLASAASDVRGIAAIRQQRAQLLANPLALNMASQAALIELDRDDFQLTRDLEVVFEQTASDPDELNRDIGLPRVASTTPRMVNVAEERGFRFQWYHQDQIDLAMLAIWGFMGGGIGVVDFDQDGWPDIYCTQGSGSPPTDRATRTNELFRNLNGQYQSVTTPSNTDDTNYSTGVAIGDVNQDGFADIFLGNLGANRLLINHGDGTFDDATEELGPHEATFTTSLAIADLDSDALPDLFECNYIEMDHAFGPIVKGVDGIETQPSPLDFYAQSDRWFRNRGDGTFASQFIDADDAKPASSLGIVVADFDGDHRNDVFVANDARPNHFLKFDSDGRVRNAADALGCAVGLNGSANACMGVASGDFDRNGRLDLHVTNFLGEPANLFLQNGDGGFRDRAVAHGLSAVSQPKMGFGTKSVDINRDGWLDLVIANGHVFDMTRFEQPLQMRAQLLMSSGHAFNEVAVDDTTGYWQVPKIGRAVAKIDFDRDSKIDLIVGHLDSAAALIRNETPQSLPSVQLQLVGTTCERGAVGSKVTVTTHHGQSIQWVTAGGGYLSSDEPLLDFELDPGPGPTTISVAVEWQNGDSQVFELRTRGGLHLIIQGAETIYPLS